MFSGFLDLFSGSSDKRSSYEDHIRPILQHTGTKLTHSDCFHWLDQKVVINLQRHDRPQIGTVKYIGSDDKGLLCAGVEFDYNIGGMSGKVNGQKLFKCKSGHGLLVPVEYVRLLADYENGTNIFPSGRRNASSSSSHQHVNRTSSVPNLTSTRLNNTTNNGESTEFVPHVLPELKIGDNVIWLGGTTPQSGIVRWIGRIGRNNLTPVKVWLEMDEYMGFGRNEVDVGTKFGCASGRGRLLPVEELILLENFLPLDVDTSQTADTPPTPREFVIPIVQENQNSSPSSDSASTAASNADQAVAIGDLIDWNDGDDNNLSSPQSNNDDNNKFVVQQDFVNIFVDGNKHIGNKRSSINELVNTLQTPTANSTEMEPTSPKISNNILPEESSPTANFEVELMDVEEADVNGNVSEPTNPTPTQSPQQAQTQGEILFVEDNKFPKLISGSDEDYLPPFIIPPINIVDFFKAEGLKGIQGKRNSCYIDVVLFSMFAFTDTFDPYFLTKSSQFSKVPDSIMTKTAKKIMSEQIVNPLRQSYYCSADGVNFLRELMIHTAKCDKLDGAFMDIEEVMLILFDKVFQLQEFIVYDNGVKDYLYQVNLGDHILPPVMTVKQCLELSMVDYKLKLQKMPSPAFIIQIPRHHTGIIQSTTIVPNLSINLDTVLKPGNESPSMSVMNLVAVICINEFHFVTFVKSGAGLLSHWVLFDSNPSEERPKVEIVPNMGEYLESMEHQILTAPEKIAENRHKFPPHVSRLLSDIYVCIYCPANAV